MATIRRLDDTTTEFAEGTLTGVQAENNSLKLAYNPVLSFDGVDDYVYSDITDWSGNYAVEFWLYTSDLNQAEYSGIFSSSVGVIADSFQIDFDGSGNIRLLSDTSNMLFTGITENQWHFLGVTCDSNGTVLYVDGVEVASNTTGTVGAFSVYKFGVNRSDNAFANVSIDAVYIWNTARTQQQIQDNMYKELTGTEPGLVAYYKMNGGTGTTLIDSAGTNDGTIYGATWVNNTNYKFSGYRVTPPLDCTDLTSISSSSVSWTETLNAQTITIETRVSTDNGNTWTAWTQVTNGGSIPDIAPGCLVECRQNLSTTDMSVTPELYSLTVEVNGLEKTLILAYNM